MAQVLTGPGGRVALPSVVRNAKAQQVPHAQGQRVRGNRDVTVMRRGEVVDIEPGGNGLSLV
jgi:hypothetical protein